MAEVSMKETRRPQLGLRYERVHYVCICMTGVLAMIYTSKELSWETHNQ